MKIVHINAGDGGGGAAIAARRHCEAMRKAGIDSTMVVSNKTSELDIVRQGQYSGFFSYLKHKIGIRLYPYYENFFKPIGSFGFLYNGLPLSNNAIVKNADIIFLHWINGSTLSIREVERILKFNKPVYWYMHDMFPITGGCHYSLDCDKYKTICSSCPFLRGGHIIDYAKHQQQSKIAHWSKYENLVFVTPSKWLGECVRQSSIGKKHKVYVVPNVIDTELFRPLQKSKKFHFGLDENKKTILFGAAQMSSIYKGAHYMRQLLQLLPEDMFEGLIIGDVEEEFTKGLNIKIMVTGKLNNPEEIINVYNACDVFVIPSIAENYPNTVLEAMACGKPCVGFRTGGIPDLIKTGITGYLVNENNVEELIKGITYIFENQGRYNQLSKMCRESVLSNNSFSKVLDIHKEIAWERYI